jgi:hypothetical protein
VEIGPGEARRILWRIKFVHTLAWAVFASAILAIPLVTAMGDLGWALGLSLLAWGEVVVLVFNRMRCPLTALAGRYTQDRADNFDIFLPLWLARHNKLIFGALFLLGELFLLLRWMAGP